MAALAVFDHPDGQLAEPFEVIHQLSGSRLRILDEVVPGAVCAQRMRVRGHELDRVEVGFPCVVELVAARYVIRENAARRVPDQVVQASGRRCVAGRQRFSVSELRQLQHLSPTSVVRPAQVFAKVGDRGFDVRIGHVFLDALEDEPGDLVRADGLARSVVVRHRFLLVIVLVRRATAAPVPAKPQ
ncbi:hypothetical protein ACIA5G_18435 [Amycolatopsis sp. NPDC051758]|uniref:hypothetical protein n=1 Tax=Amycolatopsis sp. NPDC051758 TaxID=3363935 RepID=UPI0037B63DF8